MFYIVLAIGIAFILQILLSLRQMRAFSREFVALRRRGPIACGRKAGGIHAGAIVMFLIDDKGIILTGKKMEGTTVFARVKNLPGYEGRYVGDLTEADGPPHHRNLGKALADAALTYRTYTAGEPIVHPPSPFQKAGMFLAMLGRKRKSCQT